MADRVDKQWKDKGLEQYSLEAIFQTLRHYGVSTDEPGFRGLAEADFPLRIASRWHDAGWKGTGQFSHFPAAASEELWRRLLGPALAPTDLALALIKLVETLLERLAARPDDGTLETRFKVVEAYLPKVPEARRQAFLDELTFAMGELMEPFDSMAVQLTLGEKHELAARFVALEEAIFPQRAGVTQALVRAAKGEREAALETLKALAADAGKPDLARLTAVDALLELEELEVAKATLLELVGKAEQTRDLELASGAVELLTTLLEAHPKLPDRRALYERVDALSKVFGEAPPES